MSNGRGKKLGQQVRGRPSARGPARPRPDPTSRGDGADATGGLKYDGGKLDFSLVDDDAEAETAAVLTYGATKYEPGNWSKVDGAGDRYYAALRRHLHAFRKGETLDRETKLHHLAHAACCVHFLLGLDLLANPDLLASLEDRMAFALDAAREIRAKRLAGT